QDPRHAAVFAELDLVWKTCSRLNVVPAPSETNSSPDADLLKPRVRRSPSRAGRWTMWAVAASIAVILAVGLATRAPRPTVETAVGAFQKLDLPDGSVAQLNTATAITTSFTGAERRISILRGEVFINVAPDEKRPFLVTSGGVVVRAVGTAFNVRKRDSSVEVLVTEGRVRINDAREGRSLLPSSIAAEPCVLVAGERAVIPSHSNTPGENPLTASVEKVDSSMTQRVLAWQERRLEFDEVPLAEVITE